MALYNLILSNLVQILTIYHKWINDKGIHEDFFKHNLKEDCRGHKFMIVNSKEQEYDIKESTVSIFNLFWYIILY